MLGECCRSKPAASAHGTLRQRGDIMSPAKRSALMAKITVIHRGAERSVIEAFVRRGRSHEAHPPKQCGRTNILFQNRRFPRITKFNSVVTVSQKSFSTQITNLALRALTADSRAFSLAVFMGDVTAPNSNKVNKSA